ncbi:MAG: hypothetical protein WCA07_01460 [Gloeobacterales cyanobacterium]
MKRFIPVLLCTLLTTHVSAVQAQALDAQTILAKAKEAAGGEAWDKVQSLYTKGKTKVYGVDADREEWVDLQRLRYAETLRFLAISGGLGFDGKTAWGKDINKPKVKNHESTVHILEFDRGSSTSADTLYNCRSKPSRCETTPQRVRRK